MGHRLSFQSRFSVDGHTLCRPPCRFLRVVLSGIDLPQNEDFIRGGRIKWAFLLLKFTYSIICNLLSSCSSRLLFFFFALLLLFSSHLTPFGQVNQSTSVLSDTYRRCAPMTSHLDASPVCCADRMCSVIISWWWTQLRMFCQQKEFMVAEAKFSTFNSVAAWWYFYTLQARAFLRESGTGFHI